MSYRTGGKPVTESAWRVAGEFLLMLMLATVIGMVVGELRHV